MIIFNFKTDQDFKKAQDTLTEAIDKITTTHFDHSVQPAEKTITVIDEKNAKIVEGLFKQKGIEFTTKEDNMSWIGPPKKACISNALRKAVGVLPYLPGVQDKILSVVEQAVKDWKKILKKESAYFIEYAEEIIKKHAYALRQLVPDNKERTTVVEDTLLAILDDSDYTKSMEDFNKLFELAKDELYHSDFEKIKNKLQSKKACISSMLKQASTILIAGKLQKVIDQAKKQDDKPSVFLGGACNDKNEWRKDIKNEFKDIYLFVDPYDPDWDPEINIYEELAALLNVDHVLFYSGGKGTEKEKQFMDNADKDYKSFNDIDDLKDHLKAMAKNIVVKEDK